MVRYFTVVFLCFNLFSGLALEDGAFDNGRRMNSYVIRIYKNRGPKQCIKLCFRFVRCNAVNYNQKTMDCELLASGKMDILDHMDGYRYSATKSWNKKSDECWPNPCTKNQRCTIVKGNRYVCITDGDSCYKKPCKNGGFCRNTEDGFICQCKTGTQGKLCEKSACERNKCMNGGTCIPIDGDRYTCQCPRGYDPAKNCGSNDSSSCGPPRRCKYELRYSCQCDAACNEYKDCCHDIQKYCPT